MSEPERRVADGSIAGRTCPYCRFPLKTDTEVIVCGTCHAAHHLDCWADNSGCAVIGCAEAPASAVQAHDGATLRTPPASPYPVTPRKAKLHLTGDDWPARSPAQPPPPPLGTAHQNRTRSLGMSVAVALLALAIGSVGAALLIRGSQNRSPTPPREQPIPPRKPTTSRPEQPSISAYAGRWSGQVVQFAPSGTRQVMSAQSDLGLAGSSLVGDHSETTLAGNGQGQRCGGTLSETRQRGATVVFTYTETLDTIDCISHTVVSLTMLNSTTMKFYEAYQTRIGGGHLSGTLTRRG